MHFNVFKIFLNMHIKEHQGCSIKNALVGCSIAFPVEKDARISRALFIPGWFCLEGPGPGKMTEARNTYNRIFQHYKNFS